MRKQMTTMLVGMVFAGIVAGPSMNLQAATKEERLTAKKKSWLRKGFAAQMNNRKQVHAMEKKIDAMSPEQINQLVQQVQARQAQWRQQQYRLAQQRYQQAVAYRNYQWRQQQARMYHARRHGAGFAPVITWLPQGTSMNVGAVVSPDRRYVRINAQPFFSTVGPVHTFNMQTGKYKRIR